jgi:hypothetical protein
LLKYGLYSRQLFLRKKKGIRMSEQSEQSGSMSPASDEQDAVILIKKMQQQLVFLEKKIDILIEQSSRRPFSGKHFSKPSRPFGRPYRAFNREHGETSGEKRFGRGRPFEKRHSEENRSFDHKEKVYGDSRESDFGRDRRFARRNDGKKEGFIHKKKPFPYKRKRP